MNLNTGNDLAGVSDRLEGEISAADRAIINRAAYDLQEYAAKIERLIWALSESSKAKRENTGKTVRAELEA
jgi:hypothetical protein